MKARRLAKKLALATAATLVSLLVCELALRVFFDVPVTPFLRDYDAETGTRYKKNISTEIRTDEFTMKFSTNSRGFREPEPPPSSDGCILILGDSYSEGWGVSDGEEYASLLREALDERYGHVAVPVVNAAMSASGNGRWLKLLQGEFADFEPRLVLFQVCWNDSRDNMREKLYGLSTFSPSGSGTGELSEIYEKTDRPKPLVRVVQPLLEAIPGIQSSHLFALIRNTVHEGAAQRDWDLTKNVPDADIREEYSPLEGGDDPWLYIADKLTLALVQHSLATCQRRGWPTALMSVRIGEPRLGELKKIAAEFGAAFLDIRNREERPELYYEVDSHWNQAGHRWVANTLLEGILSEDSEYLRGLKKN